MTKQEQIKFIEDNYPAFTNHVSKRRTRHNFFVNIQTEIQAYLLGFYASNGSIDEKRKTLRVCLQAGDSEIVYLFKDMICTDARTYTIAPRIVSARNGMKVQGHESFGVDITSAKLCESLVSLGFGYRKTYSDLHLPNISQELIPHFIRGYFDGDGCFTIWLASERGKSDRVRGKFDICSKSITILSDIMKYFQEHEIKVNINYLKRDDIYRLQTSSKKEVEKIYHLLYDNANFKLSRKFSKFNHYVNTEVTQLIAEYRNAQEVNVNESNNPPKSAEHSVIQDENVR